MKVATFTNGFEDVYKGNRDVKAAWMVARKIDGEVLLSGHSLDRNRAEGTAKNNLDYLARSVGVEMRKLDIPRRLFMGANYSHLFRVARELGYEGKAGDMYAYKKFAAAHNAKRKAAIAEAVNIEVVDL